MPPRSQHGEPEKHVSRSFARPTRCIFIIATPGSGSSTMRAAIENRAGCVMSGENLGAPPTLSDTHSRIVKTPTQPRNNQHAWGAWKMSFHLADVIAAEQRLVAAMLNPNNRLCWGFKEIRTTLSCVTCSTWLGYVKSPALSSTRAARSHAS